MEMMGSGSDTPIRYAEALHRSDAVTCPFPD